MNQKYIAIAAVVFIAWFSWFYRYDVSDNGYLIIDRLTGDLFDGFGKNKLNLHDTPDAEPYRRGDYRELLRGKP